MKAWRQIKWIVISVVFILALALPLLFMRFSGSEYSGEENRYLAAKPVLFHEDGSFNPNVIRELEAWLEDHIGLRRSMVNISANIKRNLFGMSPSDRVHIGKDGWYFYRPDHNLEIATGEYPLFEAELQQILQNHLAIRDKLAAEGREYVIVLPVSKASIYPEYMRYPNAQQRETPVDLVANYLEANSDLKVIRLKEALLEEKQHNQVFYKTDTHWNDVGAYAAYRKVIADMKQWGFCDSDPIAVSYADGVRRGEFVSMFGSTNLIDDEQTLYTVIPSPKAVSDPETEFYRQLESIIASENIKRAWFHYENTAVEAPSVLVFGDSMFEGFSLPQLFAEHFSEYTYVFDYDIRESIVDHVDPDIVIYEMTERFWNSFPSKNAEFLR